MSNYLIGNDACAVLYLEDPATTCAKQRTYLNIVIGSGGRTEQVFGVNKAQLLGAFVTFYTQYRSTIQGNIKVRFSVEIATTSSSIATQKIVETTLPYKDVFGYSATDFPLSAFVSDPSIIYKLHIYVENNCDQSVNLQYVTLGPLQFFRGGKELVDYDFGASLGDDEKTLTFGVCKDFGSLSVKDTNKKLLGLLSDPTQYGLNTSISHYPMRVEFFIGKNIYGVFEVERLDYDDGSHVLSIALQSPFDELERILIPPLYYTEKMKLAKFLSESVSYAKQLGHETMLSMFDFASICGTSTSVTNCLGRVRLTPLIESDQIDMLQLLGWVAEAAALNIVIYPTVKTDMHYGLLMVPWFGGANRVQCYGSNYCANLTPTDLLENPVFTPLKDNYIDKITYESRTLTMASEEKTVTETFPITDFYKDVTSIIEVQSDMKEYWCGLSEMPTTDTLNAHDTWYGDRTDGEGRGPKRSELSYNNSSGKVHTSYRNLRYMMAKASTRSLLYRFRFNTTFNDVSSTTIQTDWQKVVDEAAYIDSEHDIPSDLATTESSRLGRLLSRKSAFLPGARYNTAIEMVYENDTVSDGRFWQHGNAMCPGGKYTISQLFDNFQDKYNLRLKLPSDTRFVAGSPISLTIKINYWYTRVFGGWDSETLESSRWSQRYATGAYREYGGPSYMYAPNCYTFNDFTSGMSEMADYFCVQYVGDQKQVESRETSCTFVADGDFYVPQKDGSNLRYFELGLWTRHALTKNNNWLKSQTWAHWYEKTNTQYGGYYRYNRVACPPRLYDNQNPSASEGVFGYQRYYHTGDDDDAKGSPITIKSTTLSLTDVLVSRNSVSVPVALPSSSAAVSQIRSVSRSNIFGTDTGANAYCCFLNPPFLYSFLYTNGFPPGGLNVPFLDANMSFDKPIYDTNDIDNDNAMNYFPSNPVYGYIVKDIVATITYTPYVVENLGEVTKQYNEFGRSNYNLSTNDLMVDEGDYKEETYVTGTGWTYTIPWLVETISDAFSSGKHVAKVKTRMKMYNLTHNKLPIVGDYLSNLRVSKGGQQVDLVSGITWRVKSVEYVSQSGDSYVLLGLIEAY